ncbi:MAG: MBL fold metallo-hydrolase, partial [Bryobacteraceae bacterium]|nr:MBL fold metallo-hydrolase [Bryobacteraceae bacterium]
MPQDILLVCDMIDRIMCDVSRRNILLGAAAAAAMKPAQAAAAVNEVDTVSNGVYFHQGDIEGHGHCNNGWVIFKDYVLVIDANFPSGAQVILPKIRAITQKPIRFAFDTHHHGDHAYGNQVWIENGATAVGHVGVAEEMKRHEPGRWDDTAKSRPDVAASRLTPPSLLFPKELYFDDGEHRVELLHLGVAHTRGDAFAWLPKERILFSGDACVNGAYNFVGDGDVEKWVATLDGARKLGARVLCPGHGPRGAADVLEDQQQFFAGLRERVGALVKAKKTPGEVHGSIEKIRGELVSRSRIARYVGKGLAAQVEKVHHEMTGRN